MPALSLDLASPCSARWEDMSGDDRTRMCGLCQQNVYNVAGLSSHETRALFAESEGRICVRLFKRRDGTVITADCPEAFRVSLPPESRPAATALGILALFVASHTMTQAVWQVLINPFRYEGAGAGMMVERPLAEPDPTPLEVAVDMVLPDVFEDDPALPRLIDL